MRLTLVSCRREFRFVIRKPSVFFFKMFSTSGLFLSTLLLATVYVAVSSGSEVEGVIIQVRNSRASPKWIARAGPNRQCNCSEPSSATDVMPCMSRPTFGRALVNGSCSYEVVCSENENRIPRRLYSVICHSSDANRADGVNRRSNSARWEIDSALSRSVLPGCDTIAKETAKVQWRVCVEAERGADR